MSISVSIVDKDVLAKISENLSMEEVQEEYANDIFEDAKSVVSTVLNKEGNILTKVITIVKLLIEHFEKSQNLTGPMKKKLVIDIIFRIIEEDKGPLDKFDEIIKPLVASAIDELVYVGKNGLQFSPTRNKEPVSCLCFSGYLQRILIPCFFSFAKVPAKDAVNGHVMKEPMKEKAKAPVKAPVDELVKEIVKAPVVKVPVEAPVVKVPVEAPVVKAPVEAPVEEPVKVDDVKDVKDVKRRETCEIS